MPVREGFISSAPAPSVSIYATRDLPSTPSGSENTMGLVSEQKMSLTSVIQNDGFQYGGDKNLIPGQVVFTRIDRTKQYSENYIAEVMSWSQLNFALRATQRVNDQPLLIEKIFDPVTKPPSKTASIRDMARHLLDQLKVCGVLSTITKMDWDRTTMDVMQGTIDTVGMVHGVVNYWNSIKPHETLMMVLVFVDKRYFQILPWCESANDSNMTVKLSKKGHQVEVISMWPFGKTKNVKRQEKRIVDTHKITNGFVLGEGPNCQLKQRSIPLFDIRLNCF